MFVVETLNQSMFIYRAVCHQAVNEFFYNCHIFESYPPVTFIFIYLVVQLPGECQKHTAKCLKNPSL